MLIVELYQSDKEFIFVPSLKNVLIFKKRLIFWEKLCLCYMGLNEKQLNNVQSTCGECMFEELITKTK